jgi:predicted permease
MTLLQRLASLWRNLFHKSQVEKELTEEVQAYLELLLEVKVKEGLSPEKARRAALIELGGVEQVKEQVREARMGQTLETIWQDLRYGVRMLLKNPGFTAVAVLTLALGIGANTAIFSVVYAVLLKPLPYAQPEQLVMLWTKQEKLGVEQTWVSEPELMDFREQAKLFEGFAMLNGNSFVLTGNGEPEQLKGAEISDNFLSLLGTKVIAGRDFAPEDEQPGAGRVVLLSHGFWQRRFGGQQSVIGSTIYLNDRPTIVAGILPPKFALLLPSETQEATNIDVWVPYVWDFVRHTRQHHTLTVIARMKTGVSLEQAQEEMNSIAAQLYPLHYTRTGFAVKAASLHNDIVKKQRPVLLVLLAAVGFVLLIACANVANLLLARAAVREKEMAVRAALGAGRIRLVRQLLTESLMLALLGGALGVLLAVWGVAALPAFSPADLPRMDEVSINIPVLVFTCATTTLIGILFGLFPALRASKTELTQVLKDGSRSLTGSLSSQRLRSAIVVIEIALSMLLLIGAGLVLRSFVWLNRVDPGFTAHNVLTMKMSPPRTKYKDGIAVANFYQQLLEKLQALPGAETAAAVQALPLNNDSSNGMLTFEGVTANAERDNLASFEVTQNAITPDYFKTMKTPLLAGRFFTPQDARGKAPVAIIDETLARRLWPDASPLGRRLTFGRFPEKPEIWAEIVGVVRRIRHQRLDANVREQVYFPHAQSAKIHMTLVVRTTSDPLSMVGAVRAAVQSLDPDQPVYQIRTLDEVMAGALAPARFTLFLLLLFAGVAAVLAVVGIYGVMSHVVTQRTHEIGIRIALGAGTGDVLRLVIRQGLKLALLGVIGGLIVALLLTRLMQGLLFGVSATDPLTFATIALLLMFVALLACYAPSRRAIKVDPLVALRYE